MKFLIDAQLPHSLGGCFVAAGHEALHTLDLPDGNRTSDDDIIRHADRMDAVIVTKDQDFVDALILRDIDAGFSVAERLSYVVVSLRETNRATRRFQNLNCFTI